MSDLGNVLYLCDGKACEEPDNCAVIGTGLCRHTTQLAHALHKDVDLKDFISFPSPIEGKVDLWEPTSG